VVQNKKTKNFMPETLLQWAQAVSLIIGVAIIINSFVNKLGDKYVNMDRRITRIEYKIGIKN